MAIEPRSTRFQRIYRWGRRVAIYGGIGIVALGLVGGVQGLPKVADAATGYIRERLGIQQTLRPSVLDREATLDSYKRDEIDPTTIYLEVFREIGQTDFMYNGKDIRARVIGKETKEEVDSFVKDIRDAQACSKTNKPEIQILSPSETGFRDTYNLTREWIDGVETFRITDLNKHVKIRCWDRNYLWKPARE